MCIKIQNNLIVLLIHQLVNEGNGLAQVKILNAMNGPARNEWK
jgi:hypothetical protein